MKTRLPSIWNENSPLVRIIALQYEDKGLHQWNNARVAKLARALGKSVWVLAAQAGCFRFAYSPHHDMYRLVIDKARIQKCWTANHWPVWLTLHFQRLEDYEKARQKQAGACLLSTADEAAVKVLGSPREIAWSI